MTERVLILDFGSQYTQLIARRIREQRVYCEIHPCTTAARRIRAAEPRGDRPLRRPGERLRRGAPRSTRGVFELGVPVLGICYGLQLMAHLLGGNVERGDAARVRPRRGASSSELGALRRRLRRASEPTSG